MTTRTQQVIVALTIIVSVTLVAVDKVRHDRLRAGFAANLRQIAIALQMYSNQSRGEYYPELSGEAGRLMFRLPQKDVFDRKYPVEPRMYLCPGDSDSAMLQQLSISEKLTWPVDDHSYFYLGYMVTNDEEMAVYAEAYRKHIADGKAFGDALPVPEGTGTLGGDSLKRLSEPHWVWGGATEGDNALMDELGTLKLVTPLIVERPENHKLSGGHVVFWDGHVEYIPYPGKWPMTERFIKALESLDALKESHADKADK